MLAERSLPDVSIDTAIALAVRDDFTAFSRFGWLNYQHKAHLEMIDRLLEQVALFIETGGDEGIGNLMLELPPRHGKCLAQGILITLASGERKPVEELCPHDMVISLSDWYNTTYSEVVWTHENGVKPVLKITLFSGREIVCTENHPLLTVFGWTPAEDLRVGDSIAVHRKTLATAHVLALPDGYAALLGYIVGDGTHTERTSGLHITMSDPEVIEHVSRLAAQLGWIVRLSPGRKYDYTFKRDPHLVESLKHSPGYKKVKYSAKKMIARYMPPALAGDKRVPERIFVATRDEIAHFLAAYFNCDGTVTSYREGVAEFYSVSKKLLLDIQQLLNRFEIYSVLRSKKGVYKGKPHYSWRLSISGVDLVKFADEIPVIGERGRKLQSVAEICRSKRHFPEYDAIPNGWQSHMKIGKGTLRHQYGIRVDKNYKRGTARHIVAAIAEIDDNDELRKLVNPSVIWERIVKIESLGDMPTYDVEVKDTHNYSVEGIVSHNTRKVSQLFPAWVLGRNPNKRVIMASYGASLATKNSRQVRAIMRTQRYIQVFGVVLAEDSQAKDHFDVFENEGGLDSVGKGGAVTGKGADLLITDDLVKSRQEVESAHMRDLDWDWLSSDLLTRKQPGAAHVSVMTRWHGDDVHGRLILEHNERWTRLTLPALAEAGDPLGRKIGEALCPDWYNEEDLLAIKAEIGEYPFASLYQQSPMSKAGGLFKKVNFQEIEQPPSDIVRMVRFWDLALSENQLADYSVGVLMGITRDGLIIVLDVRRFQKEWDELPGELRTVILADGQRVMQGVETAFYQSRAVKKLVTDPYLHGYSIRGYRPEADKYTRALPFAARAGERLVYVLRRAWTSQYIEEMTSFPLGAHDDQVDASSGAYMMLEKQPLSVSTVRYA